MEQQRKQLEALLRNPDKSLKRMQQDEADGEADKKPKEKVLNAPAAYTTGSTAAAGSGEFHIAKAVRRKMLDTRLMEKEQDENEKFQEQFTRKQTLLKLQDDSKTEKNRLRRQRRKMARTSGHGRADLTKKESDYMRDGKNNSKVHNESGNSQENGDITCVDIDGDSSIALPNSTEEPSDSHKTTTVIVDQDDEF